MLGFEVLNNLCTLGKWKIKLVFNLNSKVCFKRICKATDVYFYFRSPPLLKQEEYIIIEYWGQQILGYFGDEIILLNFQNLECVKMPKK